ncbi:uncharacterized protein Triagg1_2559 [Trichoderma aggressivum f. europaeum]|uniref:Uncharacterized protein n=1 Tax=Trichoderma aggressivum f. europaeum TaxID=173218 RepID=A0AAE1II94_9HYPO|nr:hypothetical protein Triagg1_2559 [Trichoderma aggressivum f. europaeum]
MSLARKAPFEAVWENRDIVCKSSVQLITSNQLGLRFQPPSPSYPGDEMIETAIVKHGFWAKPTWRPLLVLFTRTQWSPYRARSACMFGGDVKDVSIGTPSEWVSMYPEVGIVAHPQGI